MAPRARLADLDLPRPVLLAAAAPAEVRALLGGEAPPEPGHWVPRDGDVLVLRTGVGKAAAAEAVARTLAARSAGCVLSVGVCGSLPGPSAPAIRSAVLATRSVMGDEGLAGPAGFTPLAEMGFPVAPDGTDGFDADPALLAALRPLAEAAGPIATVSCCSGRDDLALDLARRSACIAEAMEGAAVALAAARAGVPFAELRVVSNTTGDRPAQRWDLPGALAHLAALLGPPARG